MDTHFDCQICKRSISKKHLQDHFRKIHNWENAYKCNECQTLFPFPKELSEHLTSIHELTVFTCEFCDCPFTAKDSLKKHIKSHLKGSVHSKIKKISDDENIQTSNGSAENDPSGNWSENLQLEATSDSKALMPVISGFVECPQCEWKSTIYEEIQQHFENHFSTLNLKMDTLQKENQKLLEKGQKEVDDLRVELTAKDGAIASLRHEVGNAKDQYQAMKINLMYDTLPGTSRIAAKDPQITTGNKPYIPSFELNLQEEEVIVMCDCTESKSSEPFYTQLGFAPTSTQLRKIFEKRLRVKGSALKMLEATYHEETFETTCPTGTSPFLTASSQIYLASFPIIFQTLLLPYILLNVLFFITTFNSPLVNRAKLPTTFGQLNLKNMCFDTQNVSCISFSKNEIFSSKTNHSKNFR